MNALEIAATARIVVNDADFPDDEPTTAWKIWIGEKKYGQYFVLQDDVDNGDAEVREVLAIAAARNIAMLCGLPDDDPSYPDILAAVKTAMLP